jgi:hypothetical protein
VVVAEDDRRRAALDGRLGEPAGVDAGAVSCPLGEKQEFQQAGLGVQKQRPEPFLGGRGKLGLVFFAERPASRPALRLAGLPISEKD